MIGKKRKGVIMRVLKFKCELLSDVILNQKAATEGPNRTLDFIPGSNFLGIAAGKLYKELGYETARRMFHSDEVRFGDAHPAYGSNRMLRIPAALFYPKLDKESERTHWVHHKIANPDSSELREAQLKQERAGFVDFTAVTADGGQAVRMKVATDFAIKSAYDRDTRRSKDQQMFGYQSIEKGATFYFRVEMEDGMLEEKLEDGTPKYEKLLTEALCGIRRIGRSRCAQYGLVDISKYEYTEVETPSKSTNEVVIYADSRLIFLDSNGLPTLQPTITQLLGKDTKQTNEDKICWSKSQIGIFKYAPYNYTRGCFDADRYGFEKGSVIVLEMKEQVDVASLCNCIGYYQNEGFGKVIFNPAFLEADEEGKTKYNIIAEEQPEASGTGTVNGSKTELMQYIDKCMQTVKINKSIYVAVNEWVQDNSPNFKGEAFAAQWGTIRDIAIKSDNCRTLSDHLFKEGKGYLVHGVAKEKWTAYLGLLKKFIDENSEYAPMAVVNLASQMQKECGLEEKK